MAISYHKDITSTKALFETIMSDGYAYRWFIFLVVQPSVNERAKENENLARAYAEFRKLLVSQTLCLLFFCLIIIIYLITKNLIVLIAVGLAAFLYLRNLFNERKCVANLSLSLIEEDFDQESIGKKTLFQIAEYYSQKYKIPSLVDAIYTLDKINRRSMMAILFALFFVYPLWYVKEGILVAFLIYFLIYKIASLNFFYKRIR